MTPRIERLLRWSLGILLIGHGLIHALGAVEILGIADVEDLTGVPSFDIGRVATDIAGLMWPLALVVLVAAGFGLLSRGKWWRLMAITGAIVSQLAIIMWWDDAAAGTIPNILIIGAVALAGPMGLLFDEKHETRRNPQET